MKQIIAKFHKGFAAGIIIILISLLGVLGYLGGLFDSIEYKLYDIRVRLFASSSRPSDDIVVILLDQDSINWANRERGWGWPWPREAYAELVDYLNLSGAKSMAFDVLFTEPSIYRNARQDDIIDQAVSTLETAQTAAAEGGGAGSRAVFRSIAQNLRELSAREDDASYVRAAENFGRTVQVVVFSSQTGNEGSWPEGINKPLFNLHNFESIESEYKKLNQNVEQTDQIKALFPIKELQNAAGIIGNVTGWPDSDGVFRRNNVFSIFDGKAVPGLSSASLIVSGADTNIYYNEKKKQIEWGGYVIPVDKHGRSILNFRGSLNRYFPYWAGDVLQSAELLRNGKAPPYPDNFIYPEDLKDKYVFFGYYAQGLFDICTSPIESVYPGVGMHITMLDNILQQDFIRQSPFWLDLLVLLLPVILIVIIVLFSHRIHLTVGGTVLIFAALLIFSIWSYRAAGTWVPMAAPLFCAALSFISSTLFSYATEGSQKRFIKDAFSRYLAPSVIEQIIEDPSKLNLGGEKREMTAIFTDIQRFSSISEALQKEYADEGPKVLVNLLNLYLTEMSEIVLENGGTVDKYEGDAIIAFFGAPIWTDRHAALACRSAIQMKKRERSIVSEIMDPEKQFRTPLASLIESGVIPAETPLFTRLGINTGDMVVGNMGTPNKMNYTIMGNAVNLSARLEGVNKQYDTGGILLSEYTKDKIGDEFVIRGLSRVRVVGINTPLRLYELLDLRESASEGLLEMTGLWEKGFAAYENKEFLEAKNIFTVIYGKDKNDRVAKRYMGKCQAYLDKAPLPEDFPIDNLTEK
ncbi:MAG: adenylate/guanylate cyclase domain-containing protein [Treponema sp.]|jgi:adenylate cyclase|nr:adenylate/guanylate cyclase domain-containing protein [Treponema sp.]